MENTRKKNKKLLVLILSVILLLGCSNLSKLEPFSPPLSYNAKAVMSVYDGNNQRTYNLEMTYNTNTYNVKVINDEQSWNYIYDGSEFTLINQKFEDSNVKLTNFKLGEEFIYELNLNKFINDEGKLSDNFVCYDGVYKHELKLNKKTFTPEKIFIYKNNILVKTIEYNSFDIDQI